jgi:hypothetical protein
MQPSGIMDGKVRIKNFVQTSSFHIPNIACRKKSCAYFVNNTITDTSV